MKTDFDISNESSSTSTMGTGGQVTSTSENGNTSNKSPDELNVETIKIQLSKKETQDVARLRLVFILIKLAVAGICAFIIYHITKQAETKEFNTQYDGVCDKITTSFLNVVNNAGSIYSISKAATIYGLDMTSSSWPFITMSNYEDRAATARMLSGALYVSMLYIVTETDRQEWETYTETPARNWVDQALEFNTKMGCDSFLHQNQSSFPNFSQVSFYDDNNNVTTELSPATELGYLPRWIFSPAVASQIINQDLFRKNSSTRFLEDCIIEERAAFRGFEYGPAGSMQSQNTTTAFFATLRSVKEGHEVQYLGDPMARIYMPIYDSLAANRTVVAVLASVIHWRSYLRFLLPRTVNGIDVVLSNTCGGSYTYRINGDDAEIVGFGDLHDSRFDAYHYNSSLNDNTINDGTYDTLYLADDGCLYTIDIYPSAKYYDSIHSNKPLALTVSMALVIAFTILLFIVYDRLVEKRQRLVLSTAANSTAIVSSLFPKQVRDQMMNMQDEKQAPGFKGGKGSNAMKNFISSPGDNLAIVESQIADFYPECTVMFADIAGFTAWSSTREPANVFVLLQTIWGGFDKVAKRRKVFKVETIGDCYVAVTGVPEPQVMHYVIMARFAYECRMEMHRMMKELEKRLGPDCTDLVMRFGLHSGPVTAGVLKGDRARFQLFGDTVNTASRMESTGVKDKIQISQSTADLLIEAGKTHWITPRENGVEAKGKGTMQTYWLSLGAKKALSSGSGDDSENGDRQSTQDTSRNSMSDVEESKQDRLVDWMVEILVERMRPLIAKHILEQINTSDVTSVHYQPPCGKTCLDEVKEVIDIADYDSNSRQKGDGKSIDSKCAVSEETIQGLRCYVKMIAQMYRNNPFHNFEHACHVTMSVNKLLQRIITSNDHDDDLILRAQNFTHGLCSDHMASFAIVFSAMIHDVDHRGCSNMQLIQEEESLGIKYRNKSVAEQNSVDLSWDLLMDTRFDQLRYAIFGCQNELLRFRQFIINSVLATDIFDKELNDLRKNRWMKAFDQDESDRDADHSNRKATIVVEHIIQASDVSHTMQHWHVYQKWNRLLFKEMYVAFKQGRMKANPATFWYEGELGFFDNYIIPLAHKLKECNVFGVSSDEYLNYALQNRNEWESRGRDMVLMELVPGLESLESFD